MHASADRLEFAPPATPGRYRALILALLVHGLLLAGLTWSVQWKRDNQVLSAEAELWSAVPQQAAPKLVETAPEPVQAAPPPPPPPPKPVPVAAPPAPTPPKVDIALQQEKLRQQKELARLEEIKQEKRQQKLEKDRQDKLKLEKDKLDKARLDALQLEKIKQDKLKQDKLKQDKLKAEQDKLKQDKLKQDKLKAEQDKLKAEQAAQDKKQAALEAKQLDAQRQKNLQRMAGLAGATGAANATGSAQKSSGPSASYGGRIRARVKPNIVFTEEIVGNPTAEVEVRTAPDGTIIGRKITKSSGDKSWDEAVIKAIDKTAVLPRDIDGSMPSSLLLVFRPKDQ